jgi:hypothetical protein
MYTKQPASFLIADPGFDGQKLKKFTAEKKNWIFFLIKIAI